MAVHRQNVDQIAYLCLYVMLLEKRFFEKKSQNGRWPQLFSPKMCSVEPVLPEELKKSGCLCSKYLTSLLRHVYVICNQAGFGLSFCTKRFDPRTPVSGDLRHFDTTVGCAAHYAGGTLSLCKNTRVMWRFLVIFVAPLKRWTLFGGKVQVKTLEW